MDLSKNFVLFCQFKTRWNDSTYMYKLCQLFFLGGGDEECVPGRINAKLEMQTTVTNIAQVSPHRAQDAFFKLTNALALFAK